VEKANEEEINIAEANQIYDELWEGSTWHRQTQPDTEKQEGRASQQVGGYAHTDRQTEGTRTCNSTCKHKDALVLHTHTHTHTHTCIHIGICAGEEYDDDKVYMESTQQYIRSEARRSTLRLHSLLRYGLGQNPKP
jgi:hypothetical protein